MAVAVTKEDIETFLFHFRRIAVVPQRVFFVQRNDLNKCAISLNMTRLMCQEEIFALTYENYVKGPERDRARPHEQVWVFGRKIGAKEIYIKLKIMSFEDGNIISKCLAFHEAMFPLQYPFAYHTRKKDESNEAKVYSLL